MINDTNSSGMETNLSGHRHYRRAETAARYRLRQCMNLAFVLLAVLLMVLYVASPGCERQTWYTLLALATLLLKILEICIRFAPKKNR